MVELLETTFIYNMIGLTTSNSLIIARNYAAIKKADHATWQFISSSE